VSIDAEPFPPLRTASARSTRLFIVGLLLLTACASPEATRTRGDGPGADVGNRREPAEFHAGAKPYYKSPCVTEVECNGPLPVFGPTPSID
jgi:hypothetical protein